MINIAGKRYGDLFLVLSEFGNALKFVDSEWGKHCEKIFLFAQF